MAQGATRPRTKNQLRCFCRDAPLLAMYGVNESGEPYVHVKIYKQGKVYGETLHTSGVVQIRCRNCFRWHRVRFVESSPHPLAKLEESLPPAAVDENSRRQSLRSGATDL